MSGCEREWARTDPNSSFSLLCCTKIHLSFFNTTACCIAENSFSFGIMQSNFCQFLHSYQARILYFTFHSPHPLFPFQTQIWWLSPLFVERNPKYIYTCTCSTTMFFFQTMCCFIQYKSCTCVNRIDVFHINVKSVFIKFLCLMF